MAIYSVLADLVIIVHLLFIVFALLGGLLILWRRALVYFHVPAAIWVMLISFKGWTCPLTTLEQRLRHGAGADGYADGFVEQYIVPLIYPANFQPDLQVMFGAIAIIVNGLIYAYVVYQAIAARGEGAG